VVTLSTPSKLRLGTGFLVTPLVAGVIAFLTFWGQSFVRINLFPGTPYSDPVDAAAGFAAGVTVIAFIATFAAVVPLVVSMMRSGPLVFTRVLFVGAIVGQAPFVLIVGGILVVQTVNGTLSAAVGRLWYGVFGTVRAIALGSFIGIPTAVVFWLIAIRGTELDGTGRRKPAGGSVQTDMV
jgi:hypothetical protein